MIWLNKGHSFWDQTLLKELLEGLPDTEREVVVAPGTINTPQEVNEVLSQYPKVLVIVTSDEENSFDISQLQHPDMIVYLTYPNLEKHKNVDRFLPIGYPPMEVSKFEDKKLPWFFAGQINHKSRENLARILRGMPLGELVETEGFAQGLDKTNYYQLMRYASVVPCPGGPQSPDSFRLYEALELGAIPIPDHPEFWRLLFGEVPFPVLENWQTLPDLVENLKDRPEVNNYCFAWWQRIKRQMRYNLEDDLNIPPEGITVLVATSPIPSNPDTHFIEETVKSVRERLPDSEIILMVDGVREEQADRTKDYTEYTRHLLWKANHEWKKVYPLVFETHQHQANMTREALKYVRTPTILFMEHDVPLCGEIPFDQMAEAVQLNEVNLIRLHYEAAIHPEHTHLMLDTEPHTIKGLPLLRTAQYSQRPHVASTEFYRYIIETYFPPTAVTMIEDLIYGKLENAWFTRGQAGWNDFKVWIYAPKGDMKRSLHTDAREGEPKWEMKFE